jgi:hypothetical protein
MKRKKDKTESIVFSNDESTEILFEKIEGWEITSQVKFAVSFDNPKRKKLFEKIFEAVINETVKQNIFLIVQRIEQAAFQVSGYNPSEIEYYQSLFAKHFCNVLHSENYQTYIEDKIRELHFYSEGLELDLRTKQYEFIEEREQDKNQLTEAKRYRVYLESFIIHLKNPAPQQTETKTDKIKAPVLGLFCSLINKIGIDSKEETESAAVYCDRICGKFKLPYTDRVRQNYNVIETKKLIQELTEKVLPLIDNETKVSVEKYLDNKQPPKQNLYA